MPPINRHPADRYCDLWMPHTHLTKEELERLKRDSEKAWEECIEEFAKMNNMTKEQVYRMLGPSRKD